VTQEDCLANPNTTAIPHLRPIHTDSAFYRTPCGAIEFGEKMQNNGNYLTA